MFFFRGVVNFLLFPFRSMLNGTNVDMRSCKLKTGLSYFSLYLFLFNTRDS